MSFNDLERDLGIDLDEWLADEELRRVDVALLPHHERRDVSERAERSTSVRGDNNVNASNYDESLVSLAHRHHDGCHE